MTDATSAAPSGSVVGRSGKLATIVAMSATIDRRGAALVVRRARAQRRDRGLPPSARSSLDAGLLAAAVVLLGRPQPAQQLLAYLIGGMGLSIVFGLLIVLGLHGSKLLLEPSRATSAVIEVLAGALLIVVAVAVLLGCAVHWHPRRASHGDVERPQRQSLYDRAVGHDSVWIAWAAGAVYSVPGAYYLAGLALLAKLGEPAATNVLAILGFNLIMFALIELPLIGFVLTPDRTRPLTEKLNGWMTYHRRILIVIVAGAGGAYLLTSGLSDLG